MFIFDDRILIPIKYAKLKYRIIMKNMLSIQHFIVKVSKNIYFTAYSFHRDHPPGWESLMIFFSPGKLADRIQISRLHNFPICPIPLSNHELWILMLEQIDRNFHRNRSRAPFQPFSILFFN